MTLVGVDIVTTHVKACAYDEEGRFLGDAHRDTPTRRHQGGDARPRRCRLHPEGLFSRSTWHVEKRFNVLYGYGEGGSQYWKACYDTVFSRMEALGLPLVGPYAPEGGRLPDPWSSELPCNSTTIPKNTKPSELTVRILLSDGTREVRFSAKLGQEAEVELGLV